ncbi:SAM-dependent methyltransferase [Streptomyces sp. MAR4 CNX-425]|uniref:SAM-dependent methyltransferase n=1 Tax=Streptomyces sp. MAR4 CNX-425 TaxID=3406343 RepID=UPI003B50591E
MTEDSAGEDLRPAMPIDPTRPHQARVWDYWVGGKDHYAADREMAAQVIDVFPGIVDVARQSRAFLRRAVRHLVGEAGIRQFLDIGTGLPTANNTHEVAQALHPACRIVYADNDPLVLAHARALLTSSDGGATDYVDADVRDVDLLVTEAARTLDFSQPVALMLLGVLGNVPDDDECGRIVGRLLDAVVPGSYLVINDGIDTEERMRATEEYNEKAASPYTNRSPRQIASFFTGVEVLEPGVVSTSRWRPDAHQVGGPSAEVAARCGVGLKR